MLFSADCGSHMDSAAESCLLAATGLSTLMLSEGLAVVKLNPTTEVTAC